MNERSYIGDQEVFSIADVQELTRIPQRTIRYYINQGLIPPARGRGPTATYNRAHLFRLMLIQKLKADGLQLEQIKQRLNGLSDREVVSQFESNSRPIGEAWRRIELHADIELHVRDLTGSEGQRLDQVVNAILDAITDVLEAGTNADIGRRSGRPR